MIHSEYGFIPLAIGIVLGFLIVYLEDCYWKRKRKKRYAKRKDKRNDNGSDEGKGFNSFRNISND